MRELITKIEEEKLQVAMRSAGQTLLAFWPGNPERTREIEVMTKADSSPVTSADLASNEIIVKALQEMFPGDGILSEEIAESHGRSFAGRVWVLDPLDGTRIFIGGRPQFGILLGLCVDGEAQAGYVYVPVRDLFISGSAWGGASCNNQQLRVSQSTELRSGGLYCKRRGRVEEGLFTDLAQDSADAFLLVCQGEIDALVARRGKCSDWDLAAPAAIVKSCGGIMTDEKGRELQFGSVKPEAQHIVISNRRVHEDVLALVSVLEHEI